MIFLSVSNIGLSNSATPVQVSIKSDTSGNLHFHETDGTQIGRVGAIGDYFELKLVYRWTDGEYDVYANGTFIGTGTSTLGTTHHQLVSNVCIASDSNTTANYYVDDLQFYTEVTSKEE